MTTEKDKIEDVMRVMLPNETLTLTGEYAHAAFGDFAMGDLGREGTTIAKWVKKHSEKFVIEADAAEDTVGIRMR